MVLATLLPLTFSKNPPGQTAVLNPKPFAVSGRDDRDRGDDTARVGRLEDGGMAEAGDQRVQGIALPAALSQEGVLEVARLADLEGRPGRRRSG